MAMPAKHQLHRIASLRRPARDRTGSLRGVRSTETELWSIERTVSHATGKEAPGFNRGRNCPHHAPYTFAPRELPYR